MLPLAASNPDVPVVPPTAAPSGRCVPPSMTPPDSSSQVPFDPADPSDPSNLSASPVPSPRDPDPETRNPTSSSPPPTTDLPASPDPKSPIQNPHATHSPIQNPKSPIQNPSALLLAVAACDAEGPEIAARFNLTLDAYLDWLSSPDTARKLTALFAQAEAVRLKRLEARHDSALETLHELHQKAEANGDPVERRRAATSTARYAIFARAQTSNISRLFRGLAIPPAAVSSAAAGAHVDAASAEACDEDTLPNPKSKIPNPKSTRFIRPAYVRAPLPISTPKPDPALAPAQATTRLLHLLQTCDEPRRGHGLRALFNHFTPLWQNRSEIDNEQTFARAPDDAYRTLINHRAAVLHPTEFEDPPDWVADHKPIIAKQSFEFIDTENHPWLATFDFRRDHHLPDAPWLINSVQLELPPPPAAPGATATEHPPPAHAPPLPGQDVPLSPEDEEAEELRAEALEYSRAHPPPVYDDEYKGPDPRRRRKRFERADFETDPWSTPPMVPLAPRNPVRIFRY